MKGRKRVILTGIWLAVAALMVSTVDWTATGRLGQIARIGIVLLAVFLAGVYLFDPWGVATKGPFMYVEDESDSE